MRIYFGTLIIYYVIKIVLSFVDSITKLLSPMSLDIQCYLATVYDNGTYSIQSPSWPVTQIQTIPYNSLFVARQNAPITSIDTEIILSS